MDFENGNVLQQLRCGGVLEAVRISCAGFPTKFPFEDFVDHFWNLVPELLARDDLDDADLAKAACEKAKLQGFQIGKTKVSVSAVHAHLALPAHCNVVSKSHRPSDCVEVTQSKALSVYTDALGEILQSACRTACLHSVCIWLKGHMCKACVDALCPGASKNADCQCNTGPEVSADSL